jgi:hypothetical protein
LIEKLEYFLLTKKLCGTLQISDGTPSAAAHSLKTTVLDVHRFRIPLFKFGIAQGFHCSEKRTQFEKFQYLDPLFGK